MVDFPEWECLKNYASTVTPRVDRKRNIIVHRRARSLRPIGPPAHRASGPVMIRAHT
jgi:hypothetical protein